MRTLLKQALHSLLSCRIAEQIIYGSLTAHYLAVSKNTFKSGKHGMTGYICSAENGFCSAQLFATDNGRQSRNNLFIRVACWIKAKGLNAAHMLWWLICDCFALYMQINHNQNSQKFSVAEVLSEKSNYTYVREFFLFLFYFKFENWSLNWIVFLGQGYIS